MKFHGNLSGGRRIVPCGRTDRRTKTNLSKLTAAFRNCCVNTHKILRFTQRVSAFHTILTKKAIMSRKNINRLVSTMETKNVSCSKV